MNKTGKEISVGLGEYVTRFVKRGFIALIALSVYNLIYPFVAKPAGYDYSFESISMIIVVTLVYGVMLLFILSLITYPIIGILSKYISKRK